MRLQQDVTLGLDPKVHQNGSTQEDIFIQYRPDEIRKVNQQQFGPAAVSLLQHANDISIINGIFMSDANVSHDANLDYILTGDSESHSADLVVEIGYELGLGPLGVIFDSTLKRGPRNIMPTSTNNLDYLDDPSRFPIFGAISGLNTNSNSIFRLAQENLLASADSIATFKKIKDDLMGASTSQNTDMSSEFISNAKKIAAAFVAQLSFHGELEVSVNIDTHSDHETRHLPEQTKLWENISSLFQIFKEVPYKTGSLFDATTFMVVSEFSRTPALNSSGGKDHNPSTNSVLLAGRGIKGGLNFGASHVIKRSESRTAFSQHCASPIDFSTGYIAKNLTEARSERFDFIFPENIAATLAEACGVDRATFSNVAPTIKSLPVLKKG